MPSYFINSSGNTRVSETDKKEKKQSSKSPYVSKFLEEKKNSKFTEDYPIEKLGKKLKSVSSTFVPYISLGQLPFQSISQKFWHKTHFI